MSAMPAAPPKARPKVQLVLNRSSLAPALGAQGLYQTRPETQQVAVAQTAPGAAPASQFMHPGPRRRTQYRPGELEALLSQAGQVAQEQPAYAPPASALATPGATPNTPGAAPATARQAVEQSRAQAQMVQRDAQALTESTYPTIYGPCGLFDLCTDRDLISLAWMGAEPFLDWLGWEGTDIFERKRVFIDYVRPAYSGGNPTAGYLSDPCAAANGVEWGICDYRLRDFARLRRRTPTRDITEVAMRRCEQQPKYRIDGTVIDNDFEWDSFLVMTGLMQDIQRMVISGNSSTAGQFDGLFTSIKTGYRDTAGRRCKLMDSIIIEWNGNTFAGGAGTTWNGTALTNPTSLITVIINVIRRIRQRIKWSSGLAGQRLQVGDIVIALPTVLASCLLDAFTCWSVCPGAQYNEANLNTYEARTFRDSLMGGMFGDGKVFVDGFEIPLVIYDWELLDDTDTGDILILTRKVGGVRVLGGEFLVMDGVRVDPIFAKHFWVTDGGRFLHWVNVDETCEHHVMEFRPRLYNDAPWAQVRVQNVTCSVPGGAISPDPTNSLYPETSFCALVCP